MPSSRPLVLVAVLLALVLSTSNIHAYSVLTHEELIDLAWNDSIRPLLLAKFPAATDHELVVAHSYAYGGCAIQDMGYYPFGKRFFSNLTHYVRSGDFVAWMLQNARTLNEYAFAIGALSHYLGDSLGKDTRFSNGNRGKQKACTFASTGRRGISMYNSAPNPMANRLFVTVLASILICYSTAAETPKSGWRVMKDSARHGWSPAKLKAALDFATASGSSALMIVHDGVIVAQTGDTSRKISSYSIRKSLISALYGVYSSEGVIDISQTLEQLDIDDNPPSLTNGERQARIVDLLRSRSGVYHPVDFETQYMLSIRPARGSHAPGTFWYYNNWDFNVLGTILERKTGLSIGEAFYRRIAKPIGMQDFKPEDVYYIDGPISRHRAYHFEITARDLARFGLLYLNKGRCGNKQIIPAAWVEKNESANEMIRWHDADAGGYENLWWLEYKGSHLFGKGIPAGAYAASGAGVHVVLVIPSRRLVIVNRVANDPPQKDPKTVAAFAERPIVPTSKMGEIIRMILAAQKQ